MKIFRTGLFALVLGLFLAAPAQAGFFKGGVNLGGGLMWTDSIRARFATKTGFSLHTSLHIHPPGPFIIAPFYDTGFTGPTFNMLGGSLLYTVGMRDHETHLLFLGPLAGVVIADGESQRILGVELGYKFPVGDKMGFMGRVKFAQDSHDVTDGFSLHVGMTWKLFE